MSLSPLARMVVTGSAPVSPARLAAAPSAAAAPSPKSPVSQPDATATPLTAPITPPRSPQATATQTSKQPNSELDHLVYGAVASGPSRLPLSDTSLSLEVLLRIQREEYPVQHVVKQCAPDAPVELPPHISSPKK
ncbi:hypothetical protein EBR96_06335 [bacterium]|nr:hypothetical protein [bacterium]